MIRRMLLAGVVAAAALLSACDSSRWSGLGGQASESASSQASSSGAASPYSPFRAATAGGSSHAAPEAASSLQAPADQHMHSATGEAAAPSGSARDASASPVTKSWKSAAGNVELGRKVYNFRCYYCHGYSGDAKTLAARFLSPPPRDFTRPHDHSSHGRTEAHADGHQHASDKGAAPASEELLSRDAIYKAVRTGRPNTAMKSFAAVLSEAELNAVADFVYDEFVVNKATNTRYHTAANGWPNHERYRVAFPFATGEIALDAPADSLTATQLTGRRLYMSTCVSCHDRGRTADEGPAWELRAMSYPPNEDACAGCHRYSRFLHQSGAKAELPAGHGKSTGADRLRSISSGETFAVHDRVPVVKGMTAREKRGEQLFQQNCSFCHAADGSGRNWIGAFLEPHPRDLRDPQFRSRISRETLKASIREGLPGTSMPAWKTVLSDEDTEAVADYVLRAFEPAQQAARR